MLYRGLVFVVFFPLSPSTPPRPLSLPSFFSQKPTILSVNIYSITTAISSCTIASTDRLRRFGCRSDCRVIDIFMSKKSNNNNHVVYNEYLFISFFLFCLGFVSSVEQAWVPFRLQQPLPIDINIAFTSHLRSTFDHICRPNQRVIRAAHQTGINHRLNDISENVHRQNDVFVARGCTTNDNNKHQAGKCEIQFLLRPLFFTQMKMIIWFLFHSVCLLFFSFIRFRYSSSSKP